MVKAILAEDNDSPTVADRLVERFLRCPTAQKQQIFAVLHQQLGTMITLLLTFSISHQHMRYNNRFPMAGLLCFLPLLEENVLE